MTIINRTPHPLTFIPAGAPADTAQRTTIPAADRGSIARVEQSTYVTGEVDGVEVLAPGWGRITGLDQPRDGVVQIVSVHVVLAAQAAGRTITDLAIPGDQVRDSSGRIVACRGITMGSEAWPRAHWQRTPRLAVFGSAARWLAESRERILDAAAKGAAAEPIDWQPRDIDVAYAGMDPDAARSIVQEWLRDGQGRYLPYSSSLPLDLHCLPGSSSGSLAIPRPARLRGEDGSVDVDMGVIALLGGEEGVVFEDASSLPAILRRAAVLMSAGLAPESVASMTAQTARQGFDVVIGQGEDRPDCYFGSSTAAIGRALRKLAAEPGNGAFWVRLGELGFPADTVQYLGVGEVCPEAMAAATSGAPSGTGAVVRISIREEGACIGPVHCGPYCRSDAEAVTWLRG